MKELEKNVMCVLLQRLLDKNLITPKIFDNAREKILDTFDSAEFFCYAKDTAEGIPFAVSDDRKEESHGYTQNPC